MERELAELFEAAKKAADAAAVNGVSDDEPEVERCLDALNQLKNFPITCDALVSTQVGKRLRTLTKHPMRKIQSVASDLLAAWKKIVIDETNRKKNGSIESGSSVIDEINRKKNGSIESGSSVKGEISKTETVKVEKNQKASLVKLQEVSTSEIVKAEKMVQEKTIKVEKISKEDKKASDVKKPLLAPIDTPRLKTLIKCNDEPRDKIRQLLADALSKVASEADEDIKDEVNACDPLRVAVSVESIMFEKMGRSNGAQKVKYRSIMFNIKDPKNPDLRRKVLLGVVKPERLVTMTAQEMASEQRQQENNQIKEKALFECERGGVPKATTDEFKCGRCGQRKCTYYQMQTRSADEPMTTYVTCVNCNHHWKFC